MRCSAVGSCLVMVFAAGQLMGQDSDTIVLKNNDQKFTLLSQIEDPPEAAAFLALLGTHEPQARYELATTFLKLYPKSWLLPQAYAVVAGSAVDLGKNQEALEAGRFSLRLVPENPSLLILLANIEAQQSLFDRAIEDASDALEYLDDIERPPNMSQTEWDGLRPQMNASAYFARARAEADRALAPNGPTDAPGLRRALEDLNNAAAWNGDDTEVFYLRAIVELQLGKKSEAASDLTVVSGRPNPLQAKAKKILLLLARGTPIDAFVKTLPAPAIDAARRKTQSLDYADVLAEGYVGPEACKNCHASEYKTWQKTGMARMLRPYQRENVLGNFSPGTEYEESETAHIRMGSDKRPYFEVLNNGKWQRFYVDYTIGSKWQQGYATKLPDGRLQVLPIEYNLLQRKWINYWKMIDPPGSPRAVIEDFPKLTSATNYQQNCALCHTSQLKLDRASPNSPEHAVYLQPGIDCEMCHGPAAWHVKRAAKGNLEHRDAAQPPFDFRKANNRDAVRVCAQCHRQSAVREIGEGGEMNYSVERTSVRKTWLRSYDAFSRKAFYKDGRFRETTFIVEDFTRSACYRRGTAQCATCHSPHEADFESNLTSLKYKNNPNEMCLPCHQQYRNRIAEHSHHAANTEASQCVSCHMPRIVNSLLFKARSHQIEIPSADLTERFGQAESPNACLTCHLGKGVSWAKEQLTAWRR